MPGADKLKGSTQHRQRIDAVMAAEAFVLVGEQYIEEARIDSANCFRQPPAAIACRVGAQQPPVTIKHGRRELHTLAERRRSKRFNPPCQAATRRQDDEQRSSNDAANSHYLPAVTSTLPVSLRP